MPPSKGGATFRPGGSGAGGASRAPTPAMRGVGDLGDRPPHCKKEPARRRRYKMARDGCVGAVSADGPVDHESSVSK
jgi:hypothetical protein